MIIGHPYGKPYMITEPAPRKKKAHIVSGLRSHRRNRNMHLPPSPKGCKQENSFGSIPSVPSKKHFARSNPSNLNSFPVANRSKTGRTESPWYKSSTTVPSASVPAPPWISSTSTTNKIGFHSKTSLLFSLVLFTPFQLRCIPGPFPIHSPE